jgi:hypothetical protein
MIPTLESQSEDHHMHPARWFRIWKNNKGPLLILMGEMFRAGMTASTKLLEEESVDGKSGMGTPQVRAK